MTVRLQHHSLMGRGLLAALALVLLPTLVLHATRAWAQDEDEMLPEEPSADEETLEEDAADAEASYEGEDESAAMAAPDGGNVPAEAAETTESTEESESAAWESYNSGSGESVAQEVTKGVRVEDIVEPPTDYRYAAFGKADPFVPPVITREGEGAGPGGMVAGADPLEIPIISPLQRFSLNDLNVVGIWQLATGERKAMVMGRSENGGAAQGIIVKNGDPIGNRGGKILGIGDAYLTVREFTLAPDGTRQYEDRQMFMGSHGGDDPSGKIRFTPGAKTTEVLLDVDSNVQPGPAAVVPNPQSQPAGGTPPAGLNPASTMYKVEPVSGVAAPATAADLATPGAIGQTSPTAALVQPLSGIPTADAAGAPAAALVVPVGSSGGDSQQVPPLGAAP